MKRLILFLAILVFPTALLHPIPGGGSKPPPLKGWLWHEPSYECVAYTVRFGDTLWDIAQRLYPNERLDKMVWAIRKANGLEGADGPVLRIGQVLWVPDPSKYGHHEKIQLTAGK